MSDSRLAEIEERLKASTPEGWWVVQPTQPGGIGRTRCITRF